MMKFYLDGMLLPVTPGALATRITNQNKTVSLLNGEEYTFPEKAGLTEFSFSFWLPKDRESHLRISDVSKREALNKLSQLKEAAKPFVFWIMGEPEEMRSPYVTLEEYSIEENAENGGDLLLQISLKEYRPLKTVTLKVSPESGKVIAKEQKGTAKELSKALPKNAGAKTHTVQKGETLSLIAKRYLGNSKKWRELYQRNQAIIKNPNRIYVGQVIRLE